METDILEQAYIYFKRLLKEGTNDVGGNGGYSTINIRYHLLGFLIDYSGYNGFPVVMEDEKFKELSGKKWYHGFGHREYGESFLDSFSYHYGTGLFMDGFYLTDIETEAYTYVQDRLMSENEKLNYADISLEQQRALTAEFKMIDAKGIQEERIEKIMKLFYNFDEESIEDENIKQKLIQIREFFKLHSEERWIRLFIDYLMSLNKPALAVLLGYDFVNDKNGYVVMLNRTKLAVKQSDFEKFANSRQSSDGPEGHEKQ